MIRLPRLRQAQTRNDGCGFTLIELVVIVAVISVLMITLTTVLINSFRARNRVDISDRLEQNGNYALMEINNNFLKASSLGITCPFVPSSGSEVSFINKDDGRVISLSCAGGKIASNSADLTSGEVVASNCNNFVSCDTLPSSDGEVGVANFSFVLSAGVQAEGTENFTSRTFESKVVIRN